MKSTAERHHPVERYLVDLDRRIADLAEGLGLPPGDPRDLAAAVRAIPHDRCEADPETGPRLRALLAFRRAVLQRCLPGLGTLGNLLLVEGAEGRLLAPGSRRRADDRDADRHS